MMQVPSDSDADHLFQKKDNIKKLISKVMQRLQQQMLRHRVRMMSRNRKVLLPVEIVLMY